VLLSAFRSDDPALRFTSMKSSDSVEILRMSQTRFDRHHRQTRSRS
jgi:hypothetical protein